ncbi:unnamed protein product [Gongylonema pulchrum]|uniref:DUF4614 domain-containing protein n=1 Tax=Gongylonema pulchrum TaxID=637853 RepID=A0A183CY27_9BILA|nr:unnamed protein product [Gongylonema pulchrum]
MHCGRQGGAKEERDCAVVRPTEPAHRMSRSSNRGHSAHSATPQIPCCTTILSSFMETISGLPMASIAQTVSSSNHIPAFIPAFLMDNTVKVVNEHMQLSQDMCLRTLTIAQQLRDMADKFEHQYMMANEPSCAAMPLSSPRPVVRIYSIIRPIVSPLGYPSQTRAPLLA